MVAGVRAEDKACGSGTLSENQEADVFVEKSLNEKG